MQRSEVQRVQRHEVDRVVVVVPAHDEVDLLPGCLAALRVAAVPVPVVVDVVVVLDACTDGSARLLGPQERPVVVDVRNVGAARAAGFAAADVGARTWCATTDADSRVHPRWLAAQLRWASRGADVVVGAVAASSWDGHAPGVEELFTREYAAGSSAGRHAHVHGANLGLSGDAYLALGGFSPLAAHEDVDLVRRAEAAGLVLRWALDVGVSTSTRTVGRAPDGFADHLAALTARVVPAPGLAQDLAQGAA